MDRISNKILGFLLILIIIGVLVFLAIYNDWFSSGFFIQFEALLPTIIGITLTIFILFKLIK